MNDLMTADETSFSLDDLPEELKKKLAVYQEKLASGSTSVLRIRNDAKEFIFPDGTSMNKFQGTIIATKRANVHYAAAYQDGKISPPDCFAVCSGSEDVDKNEDLVPHSDVVSPHGYNCRDCLKFQWGSSTTGTKKGKDCSELILVAITTPAMGDEICVLEAKKGNAKEFGDYLFKLGTKFGFPQAVVTEFCAGAEGKKYVHSYTAVARNNAVMVTAAAERIDEASILLTERIRSSYAAGGSSDGEELPEAPLPESGRKARKE